MSAAAGDTEATPGEVAALRAYLASGSVKAAARSLGVKESTVKNQLANARSRMGARTTAELVLRLYPQLVA